MLAILASPHCPDSGGARTAPDLPRLFEITVNPEVHYLNLTSGAMLNFTGIEGKTMFIWDSLFVVLVFLSGRTCFNPLVKECSMPHPFSKKNMIIFNQGRNCGSSITMKNYR